MALSYWFGIGDYLGNILINVHFIKEGECEHEKIFSRIVGNGNGV